MQQVHTAARLRKVRCSQVLILVPVVMDPKYLLDLTTSWQIMELVTLGMDKLVDPSISRGKVYGDVGFLHRPSKAYKHSLQAFYVYVHNDHTVTIKPLICSPFGGKLRW